MTDNQEWVLTEMEGLREEQVCPNQVEFSDTLLISEHFLLVWKDPHTLGLGAECLRAQFDILNETFQEFPSGLAVKDLALSLLWHGLDPWPRNFHMQQVWPKVEK